MIEDDKSRPEAPSGGEANYNEANDRSEYHSKDYDLPVPRPGHTEWSHERHSKWQNHVEFVQDESHVRDGELGSDCLYMPSPQYNWYQRYKNCDGDRIAN